MMNLSNLIGSIVEIAPAVNVVEALSWDITLGAAGTAFGRFVLERMSSSSEMVPEAVDHVGLIVFGYLYEYGDLGILKTAAPLQSSPESKYPVFTLRSREKLGDTEKTQKEFEEWIEVMNQSEFQGSDYDVVTKSCVVWGMRACEYLGVEYPDNWDKVCNWAAVNSKVASLIGGSGVQSRKIQIKTQASKAPKKIASYIKKKLNSSEESEDKEEMQETQDEGSEEAQEGTQTQLEKGENETLDESVERVTEEITKL